MAEEMAKIKKPLYKRLWVWVLGFIAFIIIIVAANGSSTPTNNPTPQTNQTTPAQPTLSKADATSQLKDVMTLAKKSGLVTTYEFSEKANVVYVSGVWYSMTVQFKKDFMAKIAMLKEAITGYHHFEVRDAYSDEKVGEVTAFSGSLEVYK